MRTYPILGYSFLLATALNISGVDPDTWVHMRKITFWISLFSSTGICMLYALWISYCREWLLGRRNSKASGTTGRQRMRYLVVALLPSFMLHLSVLALISLPMDEALPMFLRYLFNMPITVVIAFLYALALLGNERYELRPTDERRPVPQWAIGSVKPHLSRAAVKPPDRPPTLSGADKTARAFFDNDNYPQTLYYILTEKGGAELQMRGMTVRFFDMVLLHTTAGARYVILRNGEKLRADKVMDEVRKRGLEKWMLKISANFYVNMLLVQYPIFVQRRRIHLQPDLVGKMIQTYSLEKLRAALTIGRGMNPSLIDEFSAHVQYLDHKGWDDFIPLY